MILKHVHKHLPPPRFLILTNLIAAGIAFIQGLVAARVLGAAGYGYIAVLTTLSGLCSNFWDVRLIDLATRLHFKLSPEQNDARTGNMTMVLLLNGAIAFCMALTIIPVCFLFWKYFTETAPQADWIFIQAFVMGSTLLISTIQSMQRLTDSFYSFGLGRLVTQFVLLLAMLLALFISPDISGYYDGLLAGALMNLVGSFVLLNYLWRKRFGFMFSFTNWRGSFARYWAERKFIFSANIYSYSKMLGRSGDILVFGYFAGDAATGIYRLARTLSDNLSVLTEALSFYYTPTFMQRMSDGKKEQMRHSAKQFMMSSALAVLLIAPTAYIALHYLNLYFMHGDYVHLADTTALLMTSFFWTCGVHPWLWPSLIHHGRMEVIAITSTIAALLQLALIALFCHFISVDPRLAALASIVFYLACYIPLLMWWQRSHYTDEMV